MKRALRILLELALLGALVGSLALVFRTLVTQEKPGANMAQPYPPPGEAPVIAGTSTPESYPPPGEAPVVAGASTPQAYPPPQDTLPMWTEEP